jgi:hypothetical protein
MTKFRKFRISKIYQVYNIEQTQVYLYLGTPLSYFMLPTPSLSCREYVHLSTFIKHK